MQLREKVVGSDGQLNDCLKGPLVSSVLAAHIHLLGGPRPHEWKTLSKFSIFFSHAKNTLMIRLYSSKYSTYAFTEWPISYSTGFRLIALLEVFDLQDIHLVISLLTFLSTDSLLLFNCLLFVDV